MPAGYVLLVASTYKHPSEPNSTGGTISNYHLMERIARARRVTVLHLDREGAPAWDFGGSHARVTRSTSPAWRAMDLARRWMPFVQGRTRDFVTEHGAPTAVFTTTNTVCALGTDALKGIPGAIIVRAFENFGLAAPGVTWNTRVALAKQALLRRFSDAGYMRRADRLVTNSTFMAGCLARRFGVPPGRITVIPQLCDVTPHAARPQGAEAAIGFVNRNADKNLGFVRDLAARLPGRRFVVYGARPADADAGPANLDFRGWESDRNRMFAQAAVWIMPSAWPEPFGRVSIEAQAADRRVLVADIGGLPETVADRRYLIEGYDPAAWAARIEELFAMPEDVVAASGAAVRARFSLTAHDRAIQDLIEKLEAGGARNGH